MIKDKEKRRFKEVKKEVKKDFYLYIMSHIKRFKNIKDLYKDTSKEISKQRLNYYLQKLKHQNLIKKIGYGVWDLTLKGRQQVKVFSLGTRNLPPKKTNLHALNIEVPIITDNLNFKWDNEVQLKNWVAKYKYGIQPLGITLMKGTKSIQIYVYSREIKDHSEITSLLMRSLLFVKKFLGDGGIKIDEFEAKVKTLHLAVKDNELEKMIPKNLAVEVDLKRNARKLLKKDKPRKAKAWTDTSPFRAIETNDVAYAENYIQMPERVNQLSSQLFPSLNELNNSIQLEIKNKKLHLSVLDEMSSTLKEIKGVLKK